MNLIIGKNVSVSVVVNLFVMFVVSFVFINGVGVVVSFIVLSGGG